MRIGLVVYGSLDARSGGFLYDRMLVEALRRSGDAVDVFPQPWKGYAGRLLQNFDRRLLSSIVSWPGDLLLEDELNHPSLFLLNRMLKRRRSLPIVSIVHHLGISESLPRAVAATHRIVERAYLGSVDGFVFNSAVTRSTVKALLGPVRSGIIATPGGDRLGPGLSDAEIARRSGEPGPIRILFAGNVIPRKGLLTLLEALAAIPKTQWRLTIAGSTEPDPSHAAAVRDFISARGLAANVHLAGYLEEEGLAKAFRSHHLFAVPSQYEGFGIVYLEAMGFGAVPIGTSAGGAAEIIEHGRSGILVQPGDSPALATAIREIAEHRDWLLSLALGARRRFERMPGWEQSMGAAAERLHAFAREGRS